MRSGPSRRDRRQVEHSNAPGAKERDDRADTIAELEQRFADVVSEIDVPDGYQGYEQLLICHDALANDSLVVKKIGLSTWRRRVEREVAIYRALHRIDGCDRFVLPLVAGWHIRGKRSCLVTPFMPLGSLGEAIAERTIEINCRAVSIWLEQATAALHWLHKSACCVHTDTKTDNFMLVEPHRIVLFDFDECWAKSDFVGVGASHNYKTLLRYDHVNFLRDLQQDLSTQRDEIDERVAECSAAAQESKQLDDCIQLVANHARSAFFATHKHERETLRGSLVGTDEELQWLQDHDGEAPLPLTADTMLSDRLKRLRLDLAEKNGALHLKMRKGQKMMI